MKKNIVNGLIFMGYQFSWFSWRVRSTIPTNSQISVWIMKNTRATSFEPQEYVNFVKSTKIGTHENKTTHSSASSCFVPVPICHVKKMKMTCTFCYSVLIRYHSKCMTCFYRCFFHSFVTLRYFVLRRGWEK